MSLVQLWREGKPRYRPAGEVIRTSDFEVAALDGDAVPRRFVLDHHYSGSYPAARYRFGLYRHGTLVGVAIYSHPCNDVVLTKFFPVPAIEGVELGRLVLLDEVPTNGESWFIARTFNLLKKDGLFGVLSFSDPIARTTTEGNVLFPGHIGTIYQASNGTFLGRGKARTLRLLPDATVFSERAMSKIRRKEKGWVYACAILQKHGADSPWEDVRAWLKHWTAKLTRPLWHDGNLRYGWTLQNTRFKLRATGPYPRRDMLQQATASYSELQHAGACDYTRSHAITCR